MHINNIYQTFEWDEVDVLFIKHYIMCITEYSITVYSYYGSRLRFTLISLFKKNL